MVKPKGLGRGLDALLMPDPLPNASATPTALAVSKLQAGRYQPRSQFDDAALTTLAESIKTQGLMQPIVVRKLSADRYEIIAGERRFRAAQMAGLTEVPIIERTVDDQQALALALIENIQREDLNALEEARALKRLHDEFSLTHDQVAQAVGRSRSAVSNLMRLTELAAPVQDKLLAGQLEMGHARALATLSPANQILLAEKIVAQNLPVRAAEDLVAKHGKPKTKRDQKKLELRDPDLARLEEELAETLGAYVLIKPAKQGAGEVTVRYASLEQLEGIIERIRR